MSTRRPPTVKTGRMDAATALFFFENSLDLLTVIHERRFQAVNAAWRNLTGWTPEELTGALVYDFVHPEDHGAMQAQGRLAREGGSAEEVLRFHCKDGRWIWLRSRARLGPDGRLAAVLRDITEERRQEAEIQSVAHVRELLGETAGVGLWSFHPVTGYGWSKELAALSPHLTELQTPDEFLAQVHPDDRELSSAMLLNALQTGQPCAFDLRFAAPDGGWRHFRNHVRPQPLPGGGFEAHGIAQEVTELANARDAARREEARARAARAEAEENAKRLNLVMTAADAGAIEIDYLRRTFWSSPEFDRIIGRSMTFADVTRTIWPIIDPEDGVSLNAIRDWWAGNTNGPLDLQIVLPSAERRWVRMFFDIERAPDGQVTRMSGLVLDIDDGKRRELALREAERLAQAAAEAKSQFLANMSHEIRTPMNGVLGVLHLLKEEKLTADGRHLLDEAAACGRMLSELLNDVIDFSRVEAGRLELHPEATDVAALVCGVGHLLKPQADGKRLKLRVTTPETLWAEIDPVRVRQALFNLLGNAVKFTTEGWVAVRLERAGPDRLRLEVEDTGPGISRADQARLFARFEQLDGSSTRQFGGSGLGLAITRRLAELMGGEVTLRSAPGEGACFRLEIDAPPAAPTAAVEETSDGALDRLRVLLVEDNPTNRLVVGKLLESLGAEVATAENGLIGVERAAREPFDLILMDVQMPVMDGLEAVERIRRSGGPEASAPIIALTANVLAHQTDQYRAAGMNGVVAKPVSPGALLAEIARLVEEDAAAA